MAYTPRVVGRSLVAAALMFSLAARADEADLDALDLKSAPVESTAGTPQPTRLFIEVALGSADQRYTSGSHSLRRTSLDFFHASRLAPGWRAVVSDRLDHIRPPSEPGVDDTLNNLREAYLSWEGESGSTVIEFGRINLRQGPAYGFNPTDFFRDGALRNVITANPFALRENRLGTVMLRGQLLWSGGTLALALAPKLADGPSGQGLDIDLGATNNRHRVLLTVSQQFSERVSGQALLYKEPTLSAQPGASLTALLGDATVAHAEWSYAREPSLADRVWSGNSKVSSGDRFAGGLTYSTASKLSLTAEVQINGLALDKSEWDRAGIGGPAVLGAYLLEAEQRQDLATHRAYLLYASQQSAGLKNLDVTAFLRINSEDHSFLSWLELRYHWTNIDLALQWQRYSGKAMSQYGLNPDRQILQFVAAYHFQ